MAHLWCQGRELDDSESEAGAGMFQGVKTLDGPPEDGRQVQGCSKLKNLDGPPEDGRQRVGRQSVGKGSESEKAECRKRQRVGRQRVGRQVQGCSRTSILMAHLRMEDRCLDVPRRENP